MEWVLAVKQTASGSIVVSLLYKDAACGDKAAKVIPPLVFSAPPEKIDNCFFTDITTAMGTTVDIKQHGQYQKQQEKPNRQRRARKAKAVKPISPKRRYWINMQQPCRKPMNCKQRGKFRDAWIKVPSAQEFAEHAEVIRARNAALYAQFDNGLFSAI